MMIANAAGVISAAPNPCAARAPTNTPAVEANPLTSDAVVKTARPVIRTRRRDSRSADPTAEQQSAAGDQQVRGDHPLQVAAAQL